MLGKVLHHLKSIIHLLRNAVYSIVGVGSFVPPLPLPLRFSLSLIWDILS